MTVVPARSVILEFPPDGPLYAARIAVFDAGTGEQIWTIRELHLYANAEGVVVVEALHIPDPWPDGTERTEQYALAQVRLHGAPAPEPVFESLPAGRTP
jgi:hypothetical protein